MKWIKKIIALLFNRNTMPVKNQNTDFDNYLKYSGDPFTELSKILDNAKISKP